MGLVALSCEKCGASLQVDEESTNYTCKYCNTSYAVDAIIGKLPTPNTLFIVAQRAYSKGKYGKAMQYIEQGLAIDPHHEGLLSLEIKTQSKLDLIVQSQEEHFEDVNNIAEAEQHHLQATFILNQLQANLQVYGSNSIYKGATPADVNLALQYVNRSLEYFPDNPIYLNTKALLLWEGIGNKKAAKELFEKAAEISPRDITIQDNLKKIKSSSSCFIATAAFGTPLAEEVHILCAWRDEKLITTFLGKAFVACYYLLSPTIAKFISNHKFAMVIVRSILKLLIKFIAK